MIFQRPKALYDVDCTVYLLIYMYTYAVALDNSVS